MIVREIPGVAKIDDVIPHLAMRCDRDAMLAQLELSDDGDALVLDGTDARAIFFHDRTELFFRSTTGGTMRKVRTLEHKTMMTKFGNAWRAAGRVALRAMKGEQILVPDEEHAARKKICETCEAYNPAKDVCTKCGCRAMAAKAKLASERCPLAKW